ncbi:uncharacterized protein LOC106713390 isoform X2 [Papilio machaon]|uniref:uncharacterized protein LOC106713390 isoform X2 n=1 Tax=Papilio machaon TaxID=76193 RepID=UPI001E665354|nr:uncharacterized protein LOC106713390 isoform X2 [Papilio machaon]
MGQAGSQPAVAGPQRARRDALPHEPLRLAPKVLPSLPESPCLRSTDNGAILHSGGTISGRRPASGLQESWRSHRFGHPNAYRSRSGGGVGGAEETRSRERDPLHRSYTNLGYRNNDNGSINKRFGSEPDLRIEEPQKQKSNNKHFRKKYRAPPPPSNRRDASSPDSSLGKARPEPQRKLRLFKTRNETKKTNGHSDSKIPTYRNTYTDFKSLDLNDQSFERRYKSPCISKDQHLKYPDNKDMMQSSVSLKREERLLQNKQEARRTRTDVVSGCRAKTSKTNDQSEAWKTPLLIRNFRYSERFKKDDSDHPTLRREKTFDNSLIEQDRQNNASNKVFEKGIKTAGDQKNGKVSGLADRNQPLRKSLPSLLPRNEEKDEFQTELKKATNRIRNELGNKVNLSENKTSQLNKFSIEKPNPTKTANQAKVKESSLKRGVASTKPDAQITNNRRPLTKTQDINSKSIPQSKVTKNNEINKFKLNTKENNKPMPDRGQASGKESTPEHSPNRNREIITNNNSQQKQKSAPSKQFYFGMIESEQSKPRDHTKDFPGLGCPIIEEFDNFHLIEQKLLSYREEDDFEKFNKEFREDCKLRIVSSESAVSSEGSSLSERSPTMGRRTAAARRSSPLQTRGASPNTAWRHLVSVMDSYIKSDPEPLAVETKMTADVSAESSPRSDPSADKSGDSGISGDHAHSDHRLDSPTRQHLPEPVGANWTPQQDLGDSSSEGAGATGGRALEELPATGLPTYSPGAQPFSLSLPRELHDKGKQLQQGFHSLQKFRKSVSGALGAALGGRRFDIEHEPMLEEPEQNWFLTKSAPNSLSNPLLFQPHDYDDVNQDNKKEKEVQSGSWRAGTSYMSWGGHVMYLPPAPAAHPAAAGSPAAPAQPLSLLGPLDRPIRSKSSGCLEASARAARSARAALAGEMRERERSASPELARAVPATVRPVSDRNQSGGAAVSSRGGGGKRFAFQSTVRRRERRRLAERLARDAELREQQRRTELEAMRRVEEEFQRKRAREKASIRQQLRLVSSGATSLPTPTHNKGRDEPEGCSRGEGAGGERTRESTRARHSNPASDTGSRSKSSTPIRCVELSEWRTGPTARVYRDWAAAPVLAHAHAHAHPPACATITHAHAVESEAFSGSPRSDNYRLEFARGRSPRTPRPPRLVPAPASPSSSGSELSLRALRVRESGGETEESPLSSKLTSGPARASIAIR